MVSSGYADVNGIKLYHEIYGRANPWCWSMRADNIGEMQGHGHTPARTGQ
jgi:hypothetical protein